MTRLIITSIVLILAACSNNKSLQQNEQTTSPKETTIVTDDYEIVIPEKQEALLILFPCFPCNAENTRTEFNIVEAAIAHNVTVLMMNFNQRLWLTEVEKNDLEKVILDAAEKHSLTISNSYIGGFSSGGNVSLLFADYLKATNSAIQPKGIFIADSPIDLLALYETAQQTIARNFSEIAIQEANWITDRLGSAFGVGDTALANYTKHSPYISKTHAINNLSHLRDIEFRLYSEPDTAWWKENRQAEYENMNAYYIEKLSSDLSDLYGEDRVSYIKTQNRGYRANGDRHPHSWSIINEDALVNWILGH